MKTLSSRFPNFRISARRLEAAGGTAEFGLDGGFRPAPPADSAVSRVSDRAPDLLTKPVPQTVSTLRPVRAGESLRDGPRPAGPDSGGDGGGDDLRAGSRASSQQDAPPQDDLLGGAGKRGIDLCIAVAVLLVIWPLLLAIAVAIRATMGGPVIYRHRRVGCRGGEFDCLKFRTMVTNADEVLQAVLRSDPAAAAEWQRTQKLARDPRITWVGHTLRRTSLDELPQLINVLRGDMSCVGPRPIVRAELARYGARGELFRRVRPGMTGLWQVSGRSAVGYDERVGLDCRYVADWSIWCDVKIMLRTIPAVLNTRQTS